MRSGQKVERQDETRESMTLSARTDLDKTMTAALIDEETGIMRPGMLPKVDAATPAGAKALLNGITQARVGGIQS